MTEVYQKLNENALREAYIAMKVKEGTTEEEARAAFDAKVGDKEQMAELEDAVRAAAMTARKEEMI